MLNYDKNKLTASMKAHIDKLEQTKCISCDKLHEDCSPVQALRCGKEMCKENQKGGE
jgi:hypothetical protein